LEDPKDLINPMDYLDEDEGDEEDFEDEDGMMTMEEIERAVANSDPLMEKAIAWHSTQKKKDDSSETKPLETLFGYDPIQSAVDQTPGLTYEKAKEMAKKFGF
jgi:hypothetical protein